MKLHRMFFIALIALGTAASQAQYVGPNGSPTTVKQLVDSGLDDTPVVLKGRILSRGRYDDHYQFSDGTASVTIKIDKKRWPANLRVDEKTVVEISGEYDKEMIGPSKIKVHHINLAN